MAGEVDDREQEIAQLQLALGQGSALGDRGPQLGDLLLDLGQDRLGGTPVEADPGRALLQLECAGQCREADRHVGEDAGVGALAPRALPPCGPPTRS